ncbi:(+)-neomenthol dehydrogenase-like isoform X2 [Arachis stenosperma]|uniref:(+)-neomenthol dehydrogenase-like isoform X2 n=1 Tax=Arachis stenosperma TaxID=217475 RepID=UPI0025ABF02F|nr:(+)-neomenthol dehydrogenase-like isoform X2 [Arachis stenosperma]
MGEEAKRYAVVTGANKGIGFGICKKLASTGGVVVVLTARDEKRGLEAIERLKKEFGLSDDSLLFHQLDVTDPPSVASLAAFVKTRFGKLDILVNNAGVPGGVVNGENVLRRLSTSPRIVNVSSAMGVLKHIPNEWARGLFEDIDNLTNQKLGDVLREFLKDYKKGSLESKNWPIVVSGYTMSKAALNAYTRMLAKKFPNFRVNCVCPGFVKTDLNENTGFMSIDEGAESPVRLALLPDDSPSGQFYSVDEIIPF